MRTTDQAGDVEGGEPVPDDAEPSDEAQDRAGGATILGRITASGFIAPAAGLIGIFLIFPALWTLYLGLTDVRLTGAAAADPQFVGLDNYTAALQDSLFWNALVVTLIFVLGSAIVGQTVLGFTLAWVLRGWRSRTRQVIEVLVILAWIMPGSVVAFLWIAFLDGRDGTLNAMLPFVTDTEWLLENPLTSIIVFNTWRGTAFAMLLFGAAINSIPPSHLETARLAGASGWQQLRDVVLPRIRGHLLTALLLLSMWTFNLFTPYLLTQGGPNFETEILPIYVFREAFNFGRLGYGAAISAIMLLINLLIALFYIHVLRERNS